MKQSDHSPDDVIKNSILKKSGKFHTEPITKSPNESSYSDQASSEAKIFAYSDDSFGTLYFDENGQRLNPDGTVWDPLAGTELRIGSRLDGLQDALPLMEADRQKELMDQMISDPEPELLTLADPYLQRKQAEDNRIANQVDRDNMAGLFQLYGEPMEKYTDLYGSGGAELGPNSDSVPEHLGSASPDEPPYNGNNNWPPGGGGDTGKSNTSGQDSNSSSGYQHTMTDEDAKALQGKNDDINDFLKRHGDEPITNFSSDNPYANGNGSGAEYTAEGIMRLYGNEMNPYYRSESEPKGTINPGHDAYPKEEISEDTEEPEDPEDTEEPEEPEEPEDSEDTEEPEEPEDSEDIEEPEDPEDTEEPEEPEDSEDPEDAEDIEDTEEPEEPEDSEDMEDTEEPEAPEDTEDPEDADDSEDPEDPESAENPEASESPEGTADPGDTPEETGDTAADPGDTPENTVETNVNTGGDVGGDAGDKG